MTRGRHLVSYSRQTADVIFRLASGDCVELVNSRRAKHVQNQRQLMMAIISTARDTKTWYTLVSAWEQRFPVQHLGKDAPDRPDVDGLT